MDYKFGDLVASVAFLNYTLIFSWRQTNGFFLIEKRSLISLVVIEDYLVENIGSILDILLISIYMVISNFVFEKALSYTPWTEWIFGVIANIFLFLPILFIVWSVMIWIMRLHDLWWKWVSILLLLVPLVNIWILFKIWFEGSEEWKNKFGMEPKKLNPYINVLSVVLIILSFLLFFYGMIYIGIRSVSA